MESRPLTLSEALKTGRLQEFIDQQEASGVGPVDSGEIDEALTRVITSPAGSRRASRSPDRGGSRNSGGGRGAAQRVAPYGRAAACALPRLGRGLRITR